MFVETPSVLAYHQISIQNPQLVGRGQAPPLHLDFRMSLECLYVGAGLAPARVLLVRRCVLNAFEPDRQKSDSRR